MADRRTPADLWDDDAADRDDAADLRDDTARGRDDAADQRDVAAAGRDVDARTDSEELAERFRRICDQIVGCFTRLENSGLDLADLPDLTPAALSRVEAHITEQRRLAGQERAAVIRLLDQLHEEFGRLRHDRRAAAADRRASARDRQRSAGDRRDSGQDRNLSARDRGQAAIERELIDPRDLSPEDEGGPPVGSASSAELAIAVSRQLISESRDRIDRVRRRGASPAVGGLQPSTGSPVDPTSGTP